MLTREQYIKDAIQSGSELVIRYKAKRKKVSKRVISKISMTTFRGRNGYISAYCHMSHKDRTFKISRILSINGQWFLRERLSILGYYLLFALIIIVAIAIWGSLIYFGYFK